MHSLMMTCLRLPSPVRRMTYWATLKIRGGLLASLGRYIHTLPRATRLAMARYSLARVPGTLSICFAPSSSAWASTASNCVMSASGPSLRCTQVGSSCSRMNGRLGANKASMSLLTTWLTAWAPTLCQSWASSSASSFQVSAVYRRGSVKDAYFSHLFSSPRRLPLRRIHSERALRIRCSLTAGNRWC